MQYTSSNTSQHISILNIRELKIVPRDIIREPPQQGGSIKQNIRVAALNSRSLTQYGMCRPDQTQHTYAI